MRNLRGGSSALLSLVERGLVALPFRLEKDIRLVRRLMKRYVNIPMSLADGCLVRMAEQDDRRTVLTLDSDFHIYRKNGRQIIPVIAPH